MRNHHTSLLCVITRRDDANRCNSANDSWKPRCCVCVPSMVSCSRFRLPIHASPSRLVAKKAYIGTPPKKTHSKTESRPTSADQHNTERKHTNKAQSSRQWQEAPNAHRGGGNKATHCTPTALSEIEQKACYFTLAPGREATRALCP